MREIEANIEHTRFPVPEDHRRLSGRAPRRRPDRAIDGCISEFLLERSQALYRDALGYLRVTQEGKQWIANLYAHVFSEEPRGSIGGY
jgi:hypothetical protein